MDASLSAINSVLGGLSGLQAPTRTINYKPLPTFEKFHASNAFFKGVRGPVGSGKTAGCIAELYFRSLEQVPDQLGVRRTRWAVVRQTYTELANTTIREFKEWLPEPLCKYRGNPIPEAIMRAKCSDGTTVEATFVFVAMERDEDIKRLLSSAYTGAYINEASEISIAILRQCIRRSGRFPKKEVAPITWAGVIADTNSTDDDHWWYKMAEEGKGMNIEFDLPPELEWMRDRMKWEFYSQPAALIRQPDGKYIKNPDCENAENQSLGFGYWFQQLQGSTKDEIDRWVLNKYVSLFNGLPVYSSYNEEVHWAKEVYWPVASLPVYVGWDFGLTPAAVFAQLMPSGQLRVIDECTSEDVGLEKFWTETVKPLIAAKYNKCEFISTGDPGESPDDVYQRKPTDFLHDVGMTTSTNISSIISVRIDAVNYFLTRLVGKGLPAMSLSRALRVLPKGFRGGYQLEKVRTKGSATDELDTVYKTQPKKNSYSHPHDALQHLCSHIVYNLLQNSGPSRKLAGMRVRE